MGMTTWRLIGRADKLSRAIDDLVLGIQAKLGERQPNTSVGQPRQGRLAIDFLRPPLKTMRACGPRFSAVGRLGLPEMLIHVLAPVRQLAGEIEQEQPAVAQPERTRRARERCRIASHDRSASRCSVIRGVRPGERTSRPQRSRRRR